MQGNGSVFFRGIPIFWWRAIFFRIFFSIFFRNYFCFSGSAAFRFFGFCGFYVGFCGFRGFSFRIICIHSSSLFASSALPVPLRQVAFWLFGFLAFWLFGFLAFWLFGFLAFGGFLALAFRWLPASSASQVPLWAPPPPFRLKCTPV